MILSRHELLVLIDLLGKSGLVAVDIEGIVHIGTPNTHDQKQFMRDHFDIKEKYNIRKIHFLETTSRTLLLEMLVMEEKLFEFIKEKSRYILGTGGSGTIEELSAFMEYWFNYSTESYSKEDWRGFHHRYDKAKEKREKS